MKLKKIFLLLILPVFILNINAKETKKQTITIAAAASMTDVLKDIIKKYQAESKEDTKIQFTFASSGIIKSQIENGSPIDIFIFANIKNSIDLEDKKLVKPGSVKIICKNSLVCITAKNNPAKSLSDITKPEVKFIAIGNPGHVPAGKYAKLFLEENNLWDVLSDKYVYAENVRQVLSYVEVGNAEMGFVYKTDALISDKIKVIHEESIIGGEKIAYTAGITLTGQDIPETEKIINYFFSDSAKYIFKEYGFTPMQGE